jgi:GR25 family glycosyltransferase involved in LPS biosynthesis
MCEDLRKRLGENVSFSYVTDFEPEALTSIPVGDLVNLDPFPEPDFAEFNRLIRPMTLRSVSNNMKHMTVMRRIGQSQHGSDDFHLVLEDDVCFADTISEQLTDIMKKLRSNEAPEWDMVFLGFPGIPSSDPSVQFVPMNEIYRVLPGCDSYFIKPACAAKLASFYMPMKLINNAQLSYLIQVHNVKALMSTPHVFVEGSKLGIYVSVLNPNNLLIYNPIFREMFEIVHKEAYVEEDKKKLDVLWEKTPFKSHPDFLYLKGLFLLKDRQFSKAKEIFERVFRMYTDNKCIIRKDSVFLNNYIELCKVFQ